MLVNALPRDENIAKISLVRAQDPCIAVDGARRSSLCLARASVTADWYDVCPFRPQDVRPAFVIMAHSHRKTRLPATLPVLDLFPVVGARLHTGLQGIGRERVPALGW